ncbi:MAG: PQQ-dependent sugar dehydrogenase [Gulosibacter sp.]|uniref:PQQ-dependent sugar dehydrogenase n=1 Tax=Gulosibacter sp. TaxID=2817531 RepID=UPI003F90B404
MRSSSGGTRGCLARSIALAGVIPLVALAGCAASDSVVVATPTAASETQGEVPDAPVSSEEINGFAGVWSPADAEAEVIATGLEAPWSVIPFDDGYLVSQRDDGAILHVAADGATTAVGQVEGVVSGGESGLHGLALLEESGVTYLYAYHGAAEDNRVVRMELEGEGQDLALGASEEILTGIPRNNTHNGGRIQFGPDGYLYIATGDAQDRDAAQDEQSLSGKILRVDAEGEPAADNPFGNTVYSLGHRNVQGMAWTSDGTMWASEFGQDTWDELNRIEPGGNYGWPTVEGIAEAEGFIDPSIQWSPAEASPSGIAAKGDTLFIAGLRGQQLWVVDVSGGAIVGEPVAYVPEGVSARMRDARVDADGGLLILTNNTDGRGDPGSEDDRLLWINLNSA